MSQHAEDPAWCEILSGLWLRDGNRCAAWVQVDLGIVRKYKCEMSQHAEDPTWCEILSGL